MFKRWKIRGLDPGKCEGNCCCLTGREKIFCARCRYSTSVTGSTNEDNIHPSGSCNCSQIVSSGCKCSTAHIRGGFGCSGKCSLIGQNIWLEYLWKQETVTRRLERRYRKFPCHKTHFFCNATDQNIIVAQNAAIHYKIRQSIKWLLVNLTIFTLVFIEENFPTIIHVIIICINLLSVFYYIRNLVKLIVALMQIKLERPAYWTRNCLWEKNLPRNLIRYFEISSKEGFSRYYNYFLKLVSMLRTVRSSPVGRMEVEVGLEEDLRVLGDSLLRTQTSEWKSEGLSIARGRVSQMVRAPHPVLTPKQLETYWKNYEKACEAKKVRFSVEQKLENQSWLIEKKCEEDKKYYEVPVSPLLRKSIYQYACGGDGHPSLAVASGSFYDFMKTHHQKDYCCSLKWVANMKFWLGRKMREVVEQFDIANSLLVGHGAAYVQIGSSSVTDLEAALRRNEELLTFTPLLAFLTLSHNQSYLVWRYRVLANGCLSSYNWRSGGDHRGNWDLQTGPCDAEVVLHFFSSYMDMIFPYLPFNPSKKRPFSDHYVTCSDRLMLSLVEIAIVRQWVSPPHFNVFVNGKIYEIPGGSNNLFLALSYFIYCIKIYQKGKIGRVSLDQPPLNLLRIVEDR